MCFCIKIIINQDFRARKKKYGVNMPVSPPRTNPTAAFSRISSVATLP